MPISKSKTKDIESPVKLDGFCVIDREWWNKEEKSLCGDMGWTFDDRPETKSLDFKRNLDAAINCVVQDRDEGYVDEESEPVYLVLDDGGNDKEERVLAVVTSISATDTDFLKEIEKNYPEARIVHVPENQEYKDINEDFSMQEYNIKSEQIGDMVWKIARNVLSKKQKEVLEFPEFSVHGIPLNGMSWHVGIDGTEYFDLKSSAQAMPGMQDYRLKEFFTRISVSEQDDVISGLKKASDKIEKKSLQKVNQMKM